MKFKSSHGEPVGGDLTPMIDMTFQLIAFFMVLINFTEADQNEKIQLPMSELAKPPDQPLNEPITLHVTRAGRVIFYGQEIAINDMGRVLSREARMLRNKQKTPGEATIIIRADSFSKTGQVQELIQVCQENAFEKFALRVKEDVAY